MLACRYIATDGAQLRWIMLNNFVSWCHSRRAARWCDVNVSICNIWIIVVDAWWRAWCGTRCALQNRVLAVDSGEFRWLRTFTAWRWFRSLQRQRRSSWARDVQFGDSWKRWQRIGVMGWCAILCGGADKENLNSRSRGKQKFGF